MRIIQQPAGNRTCCQVIGDHFPGGDRSPAKTFLPRRRRVSQRSRNSRVMVSSLPLRPTHRHSKRSRRWKSPGQPGSRNAFVHAFIPSADQDNPLQRGHLFRYRCVNIRPCGDSSTTVSFAWPQSVCSRGDRCNDSSIQTAVPALTPCPHRRPNGRSFHRLVPVRGKGPQVVNQYFNERGFARLRTMP